MFQGINPKWYKQPNFWMIGVPIRLILTGFLMVKIIKAKPTSGLLVD